MIIAKNDEEKRSKAWRVVTSVATAVIVIVAAYFLFTLFAGNPLEGTWISQDTNLKLTIHKGGTATAFLPDMGETSNIKVDLNYTIEKDPKTIAFKLDSDAIQKTIKASDGKLSEDAILAEVGVLDNTFDYNMNQGELTLAEREYGDQMVFEKE